MSRLVALAAATLAAGVTLSACAGTTPSMSGTTLAQGIEQNSDFDGATVTCPTIAPGAASSCEVTGSAYVPNGTVTVVMGNTGAATVYYTGTLKGPGQWFEVSGS